MSLLKCISLTLRSCFSAVYGKYPGIAVLAICFYVHDYKVVLGITSSHQAVTEESLVVLEWTLIVGWHSDSYIFRLLHESVG